MKRLCLLMLSAVLWAGAGWMPADAQEFKDYPFTPLNKGDGLLIRIENVGGGIPKYREIVDSDGNIKLPFLGLLSAVGKTREDLAIEMANAYATARLSSNATVQITVVSHFDPPPDRQNLVRTDDPRQPVPVSDTPLSAPE